MCDWLYTSTRTTKAECKSWRVKYVNTETWLQTNPGSIQQVILHTTCSRLEIVTDAHNEEEGRLITKPKTNILIDKNEDLIGRWRDKLPFKQASLQMLPSCNITNQNISEFLKNILNS